MTIIKGNNSPPKAPGANPTKDATIETVQGKRKNLLL
jgi:hypothetical protein